MKYLNYLRITKEICNASTSSHRIHSYRKYHDAKTRNVWISTSQDIYTNLALEEWMFSHLNLKSNSYLLLWHNHPCVVIGRHQNPWQECSVRHARNAGVAVARRHSGGGAVYHDLGNMCMTFFTSRDIYDRKSNLNFICKTLKDYCPVDVSPTARDDILLDGKYKVSGTAARLLRDRAYHHCTLLLDTDKKRLMEMLQTTLLGIDSNATKSIRAKVTNLSEINDNISYNKLIPHFSNGYLSQTEYQAGEYEYVNPNSEHNFPGLSELRYKLADWDWIFGKTPKFSITLNDISMNIEHSKIRQISLPQDNSEYCHLEYLLQSCLVDARLCRDDMVNCRSKVSQIIDSKDLALSNVCLKFLDEIILTYLDNIIENA